MSVDAPTERDILLMAKQGFKPILAFVVGAFLALPTLAFVDVTIILLFGKFIEGCALFQFARFILARTLYLGASRLIFWSFFGEDDGFGEMGFFFTCILWCFPHV